MATGVAIGMAPPAAALLLSLAHRPALWALALSPVLVGAAGWLAGDLRAISDQRAADLVERFTAGVHGEIHHQNVDLARNASARAEWFSALSHDMRTPLTAILGFATMAEDLEGPAAGEFMPEIRRCSRQLLDIVNDLLDTAKLEAGRIELVLQDFDSDAMVAEAISHLRPLAEEKGLVVVAELGARVPSRGDVRRARQILVNLVSNAIKYTNQGSVTVRTFPIADRIVFEVSDTGVGIAPEDMRRLFAPFEQTSAGRARSDSTGLGLVVSLGLAEAMGGTIQADSLGVGAGSTFRLVLRRGTGAENQITLATLPRFAA
jgi:signal transduction histidine kinase